MTFLTGTGLTAFGRHDGKSTLDLMSEAAELALADAGLERNDIDGLLCGYSTTMPNIMLATVFCEHFGITPSYAHAIQVGGATGMAMTMLAHTLVDAAVAKHVLVVGGENRLTPGRAGTPRSKRSRKSAIRATKHRSARPSRPITV